MNHDKGAMIFIQRAVNFTKRQQISSYDFIIILRINPNMDLTSVRYEQLQHIELADVEHCKDYFKLRVTTVLWS